MNRVGPVLVLSALLITAPAGMANAEEFRSLWIDGWHSGMWSEWEIDTMIATADSANYNVIVPQIRKKGDALYNSTYGGPTGTGEPKPSQVSPPDFDPLAYMVQEAHARGIEVHPWICTHRVPTQTYDWFYIYHNNWLTKNSGGSLVATDGYWLQTASDKTISYQAYSGTPATHNISLPKAGWSIIGCPFLTDRQWADTEVTLGAQTVSLETARNNGWLSSLGYWWDSSTQGLKTLGLPDDWPDSEVV